MKKRNEIYFARNGAGWGRAENPSEALITCFQQYRSAPAEAYSLLVLPHDAEEIRVDCIDGTVHWRSPSETPSRTEPVRASVVADRAYSLLSDAHAALELLAVLANDREAQELERLEEAVQELADATMTLAERLEDSEPEPKPQG